MRANKNLIASIVRLLVITFFVIPVTAQEKWDGPKAQPSKVIIYLATDFKNGGVTGVYRGLKEAYTSIWSKK